MSGETATNSNFGGKFRLSIWNHTTIQFQKGAVNYSVQIEHLDVRLFFQKHRGKIYCGVAYNTT